MVLYCTAVPYVPSSMIPFADFFFYVFSIKAKDQSTRYLMWRFLSSTHKIRKTYASILLSNHVDDRLITAQMGHTDIATTRGSYYFNRNSEDKNKQVISSVINF